MTEQLQEISEILRNPPQGTSEATKAVMLMDSTKVGEIIATKARRSARITEAVENYSKFRNSRR